MSGPPKGYIVDATPASGPPAGYVVDGGQKDDDVAPLPPPSTNGAHVSAYTPPGNAFQRYIDNLSTVLPGDLRGNSPTTNAAQITGAHAIGNTFGLLAHPVAAAKSVLPDPGMAGLIERLAGPGGPLIKHMAQGVYQEFKGKPLAQSAPALAGDLLGGEMTGEVGRGLVRGAAALPDAAISGMRKVTRTTPADMGKFVAKTASDNAEAVEAAKAKDATNQTRAQDINTRRMDAYTRRKADAEAQNAARMETYKAKQAEYEAAKAKAEEINKAAAETQTRRGELARTLKQTSARVVERVRRIKAQTKAALDQSYADIAARTKGETIPTQAVGSAVLKAQDKLAGSAESIKVFKDILSREAEEGDEPVSLEAKDKYDVYGVLDDDPSRPIDFRDLRGYYSEIGNKLSAGNLPGDVYQALKSLQDDIGKMQEQIANKKGVGALFRTTQARYGDYMRTFREHAGPNHSGSPIAASILAKDPTYAIKPLSDDATAARVRNDLARFDPSPSGGGGAAQLYDNLRRTQREFDGLKEVKPSTKELKPPTAPAMKTLPTKPKTVTPPPVKPDVRMVTPDAAHQFKQGQVFSRAEGIRNSSGHFATFIVALDAIRNIVKGNVAGLGEDVLARGAYSAGKNAVARVLESPKVVNALSNLTQGDVDQIMRLPPEQRAGITPLVEAAQRKGIKVSPALTAALGIGVGTATYPQVAAKLQGDPQ